MAAGVAAGLAAGCSHQALSGGRPSVGSCVQFGIRAITDRVTVTSVPPACQGLSGAQVNYAVASAVHAAASAAHGKARERARAARLSHFLARLITTVPPRRQQPVVAAPVGRQVSRVAWGFLALAAWLVTVAFGAAMLARRLARTGPGRRRPGRPGGLPPVVLAHLGLAVTSLLAWAVFLATGAAALAWAGCALLLPVAGLGMTLLIQSRRHPPVLVVAAHGVFAVATILFAVLAALGPG